MLRRLARSKFRKLPQLKDERVPKRPLSPYAAFVRDRWASGDMKHIGVGAAGKLTSTEWKELPASTREVRILFCPLVLLLPRPLLRSRSSSNNNMRMCTTISHSMHPSLPSTPNPVSTRIETDLQTLSSVVPGLQKYDEGYRAEVNRYTQDYKSAVGRDPPLVEKKAQKTRDGSTSSSSSSSKSSSGPVAAQATQAAAAAAAGA